VAYSPSHSSPWYQIEFSGQLHATAALSPQKEPPVSRVIRGSMDPRVDNDGFIKRKVSFSFLESNLGPNCPKPSQYINYVRFPFKNHVNVEPRRKQCDCHW
jgi:hypothetical protein